MIVGTRQIEILESKIVGTKIHYIEGTSLLEGPGGGITTMFGGGRNP